MIPHHLIASAARKHGFSFWILRLSLAAYRLPRAIGVEGVYSRQIVATRGITASSGFVEVGLAKPYSIPSLQIDASRCWGLNS